MAPQDSSDMDEKASCDANALSGSAVAQPPNKLADDDDPPADDDDASIPTVSSAGDGKPGPHAALPVAPPYPPAKSTDPAAHASIPFTTGALSNPAAPPPNISISFNEYTHTLSLSPSLLSLSLSSLLLDFE